jgi:hypothetical protein
MVASIKAALPRIGEFLRQELRTFGLGLVIGIAYQVYYYSSKVRYGDDIGFDYLLRFASRGTVSALAPYIVKWLIIWRIGLVLLRSLGQKLLALGSRISQFSKEIGKFEDRVYDTTESAPAVRIVVHGLRKRARVAALGANASLALIVISLVGGLFLFRSAEASAASGQIEGAVRYRETELESLRYEFRDLLYREQKDTSPDPEVKERLRNLQKQIDDARSDLREMSKSNLHPDMSMTYLWSVLSTKIGSSLLILFLVQILITLYRYSTRVAAFYEARADALQIASEVDGLSLKDLVDALSADKVDFGKAPIPPSQMIFDAVRAALGRATEVGVETAKKAAKAH